jgi:outer membrane protein insertion porin family
VGNTKTRDKVIRRQLRVFEGELFNGTGMRRSKEKVTALGFFETVEVSHKPGSDGEHVLVTVEVKEKSTGTFQVGLGFSNVESFIFTAQVAQQNVLGWGQSVSVSAQLSGLRSFFQLSYFDPYFFDTNFIFEHRRVPHAARLLRVHSHRDRRHAQLGLLPAARRNEPLAGLHLRGSADRPGA